MIIRCTILLLHLLLFTACSRGNKTTVGDTVHLPNGDWNIAGYRIGQRFEDVADELGSPLRTYNASYKPQGYVFRDGSLTMEVDRRSGEIVHLSGTALNDGDRAALAVGRDAANLETQFGIGYRVELFSPVDRGMWTVGSAPRGTVHYFRDGKVSYKVGVSLENIVIEISASDTELPWAVEPEGIGGLP